jgi:hypothetical protein
MATVQEIIDNAKVSAGYLQALVDGYNVLSTAHENMTVEELTSVRNQILCGDSFKAAFLGTINNEPTVTLQECQARGLKDAEAQMVIEQRDDIRTKAFNLVK